MNVHAHDCAPGDAARRIVDDLAAKWDPNDQWSEVEAVDGDGTLRDQAIAITAEVLHGFPTPGTAR